MENGKNRREKFKNSKPHSKKNNLNLRSGVDGTVNNPTYTVASASTVAGSVFMRRLKICLGTVCTNSDRFGVYAKIKTMFGDSVHQQ